MKTERKHFKAINFDLDTNKLKAYFNPYNDAYYKIGKDLKKQGFVHRQGSGYVSKDKLNTLEVYIKIMNLVKNNPWLSTCAKKFDVTNVPAKVWDMMNVIQGKIPALVKEIDSKKNPDRKQLPVENTPKQTVTNKVQNGLILQASQFWAFEKTTIGKKLHDGFTILSNPENQWFLLKDGLPKNNSDELAIGDKTTIDDVVAQYSSESRKDMITRFDSKQDAIDYWHKHSAEYSAMREQYPELNEYTKKAQDAIDELLPAEFKPKASGSGSSGSGSSGFGSSGFGSSGFGSSGSSARRTSRPASSSGRDERGH